MIQALYWTGLCMLILFLPRSIPRCSQVALLDNAEPQLLLHFAPGPVQDPHQLPAHPFVVAPTGIRPFQSGIPNRDSKESQPNALITETCPQSSVYRQMSQRQSHAQLCLCPTQRPVLEVNPGASCKDDFPLRSTPREHCCVEPT